MRAHDSYDYAVIRVVPRVERGEFMNVGVIVSCEKTGYLKAAVELDEARLRALDPRLDLATLRRHLQAMQRICAGGPDAGPIGLLWLRWTVVRAATDAVAGARRSLALDASPASSAYRSMAATRSAFHTSARRRKTASNSSRLAPK